MDQSPTPPNHAAGEYLRWCAAGCALSVLLCLGCWLAYEPYWVMNDATQAISVARHLGDGEGIRTGIIYYEEQYATGQVPAPQTVFPPGYPALIALVSLTGLSIVQSAYVVVSSCFVATAVLILLTARRMGQSVGTALSITLCWCGCVHCWNLTRGMMSEMPFVAFTLLSLLMFSEGARKPARWVFLSGCAAAAAFTMRYAGVFWMVTMAAFYAVSLRNSYWLNLWSALAWGCVPLLTLVVLFWRNVALCGEWTGGNAVGKEQPLSNTLRDLYDAFSQLLGWTRTGLVHGGVAELLATAGVLVAVVWLLKYRRNLRLDRQYRQAVIQDSRLPLCVGYILTTLLVLMVLNTRTPIGLNSRMILPLLPFFLLAAGWVLSALVPLDRDVRRAACLPGGLLLGALILGQLQVWKETNSREPIMATVAGSLQFPVDGVTLLAELQSQITDVSPLLTNEPHYVNGLLKRPVLGLPEPIYTDRVWTESEVHKIVTAYGVRQVLLLPEALAVAEFRPPFFDQLANGRIPDWLEPTVIDKQVCCYRVVERATVPSSQESEWGESLSPVSVESQENRNGD